MINVAFSISEEENKSISPTKSARFVVTSCCLKKTSVIFIPSHASIYTGFQIPEVTNLGPQSQP